MQTEYWWVSECMTLDEGRHRALLARFETYLLRRRLQEDEKFWDIIDANFKDNRREEEQEND